MHKIELLAPAGSMANLKAAVSRKADAVYLGMNRFSARDFATNFNEKYLEEAVKICKSNNVKVYLAMNTSVKNNEVKTFFNQLSYAYSKGIDAVIIQETSFLDIIKKNYPDLRAHISTQAGVMNSAHASLLAKADRITLARELKKEEIGGIKKSTKNELEMFCHGALCVSISGSCLFSSLLGGRSGNRGKCAQPCRKKYNGTYYLSTKELCLIDKIPDIISIGVDAMKIEGRMRTPYYVATMTEVYRKAIDSFYAGDFSVTKEMKNKLNNAFTRGFTKGWFDSSKDIFQRENPSGESSVRHKEFYEVNVRDMKLERQRIGANIPYLPKVKSSGSKLLVRVYSEKDAIAASEAGADIIYLDIFNDDFVHVKQSIKSKLFAVTPRIMLDFDKEEVIKAINEKSPDGILAGNKGMLGLNIPIHLDYNSNVFNDISLDNLSKIDVTPIISPELSINDLKSFSNRNFAVLVHGKIRLMTLRHDLAEGNIKDEKGELFRVNKIKNGSEVLNGKELGLLSKSSQLVEVGINNFFIDTENKVSEVVGLYRDVLDSKKVSDSKLKKDYVLGWSYRGVK
ncbi:U32 family peptidase [Nanoarchaeota archaeon]